MIFLRYIVINYLSERFKISLINNLLSSIFYNYFHRLFFIRESMDKKLKKFYFVLVMTRCVPPCFRSNHSSKLDRFPQYCDGETSSGLHCYAFVRCGSIQSKVIFAVSQCLCLFVKLFPMFSWQSNSQKVNTLNYVYSKIISSQIENNEN